MKKLFFLVCLLGVIIMDAYPQLDTSKYIHLQVGNKWILTTNASIAIYEVIADTVMPNGFTYYKLILGPGTLTTQYVRGEDNKVYQYCYNASPPFEALLYDFKSPDKTIWKASNAGGYVNTADYQLGIKNSYFDFRVNIAGQAVTNRQITSVRIDTVGNRIDTIWVPITLPLSITFAKGLGWFAIPSGDINNYSLRGAVINGQTYGTVSVKDEAKKKQSNTLFVRAFPNPTNGQINVNIILPSPMQTIVEIFSFLGNKEKTIYNSFQTDKEIKLSVMLNGFSSGMYFIRVRTPNFTKTEKVLYLK